MDYNAISKTLVNAKTNLFSMLNPQGYWEGELSSSALSTATAVRAMKLFSKTSLTHKTVSDSLAASLAKKGLDWLVAHQNDDGGWGDTVESPSNISTTILCWSAMDAPHAEQDSGIARSLNRAEAWICERAGGLSPTELARAIDAVYGKDRTFSVPILTMCAISGKFGNGSNAWKQIRALPFELAVCPHQWFRWLGLPVVSYALPALIAIGQVRHHYRPTKNPVTRVLRWMTREKTLRVLQSIQPESGGFLEATPLTSFVVMSLLSMECDESPVVHSGISFLASSVRADGSWPIDTNLATWVTTLSINALQDAKSNKSTKPQSSAIVPRLTSKSRDTLRDWLLNQQYQVEHPYTHAAPGGWAWTNLTGGVPDADDAAGALLALKALAHNDGPNNPIDGRAQIAAISGAKWLVDIQNKDGGIPTFCRGWGKLPFDQSSPDLTAHALRAWNAWRSELRQPLWRRVDRATVKAIGFLLATQHADGFWTPLWFGNQNTLRQENPLYGTAKVLRVGAMHGLENHLGNLWSLAQSKAIRWMLACQDADGGWGGDARTPPSIEETALAVEALSFALRGEGQPENNHALAMKSDDVKAALSRGCAWLIENTADGTEFKSSPIGLYFAKLWYTERMYPIAFTVSALGQEAVRLAELSEEKRY